MENLIVVESPTKVNTIKKFVNKNDLVMSTKGHVANLKKYGKDSLGVRIEENFKPIYEVIQKKKKILLNIKEESKKAKNILLATDPDREGEAIAQNIIDFGELDKNKVKRIRFNEITKNAIQYAIEHPQTIDKDLVLAQQARRVLDRILGFKLSSLLKNKIGARSAGRVQSIALKLIVDKEQERNKFTPIIHYLIDIVLNDGLKVFYHGDSLVEKMLTNENTMKLLVKDIKEKGLEFDKIEIKTTTLQSPTPLKTSTLIQKASVHFGYSARRTMLIAQQLYEGVNVNGEIIGLISYIRTDSIRLGKECLEKAKEYLRSNNLVFANIFKKEQKKSLFVQDSHEAIRPTNFNLSPNKLNSLPKTHLNIYKLIWYNTLSSLMPLAKISQKKIFFKSKNHFFISKKRYVIEEGYLQLYKNFYQQKDLIFQKEEDLKTIDFQKGKFYKCKEIKEQKKQTNPPKRYSISSLVKTLEFLGVGRPSTYSIIVKTLKDRLYILEKNKSFIPTEHGIKTSNILVKNFHSIINEKYTNQLEKNFDKIAKGKLTYKELLNSFYNEFKVLYEEAKENIKKIDPKKTGELCPKCNSPLVIRMGKYGEFIGCSNFPKCRYIKKKELISIGECPLCKGDLVERFSKRGKFIGCSNFPKCRYNNLNNNKVNKTR